jgi:ring-1,2-phenylacetyl-CoA epoxidase subunit PaaC
MSDQALTDYILHLGDNALILGHRNSEWTGHGPILEQDIALSNIALDLIGQARFYFQLAAERINAGRNGRNDGITEDVLAYHRDGWDFKNCLLVEQANGDWGKTILRQFFFSAYQYYFYLELRHSRESRLAEIADKSLKEVTYHLRWSGEWVVRLGDGTEESHSRMEQAVDELWKYTGELFTPAGYERTLTALGIAADTAGIYPAWNDRVNEVFQTAGLRVRAGEWMQTGGKEGKHTEQLGYLLAEMQFLQRAYPGCEW